MLSNPCFIEEMQYFDSHYMYKYYATINIFPEMGSGGITLRN